MISFRSDAKKAFFFGAIVGGVQSVITMFLGMRGLPVAGLIIGYLFYMIGSYIYFNLAEEKNNGLD